jgi:hypothetical protein
MAPKRRRSGFDSGARASTTTTSRTFFCTSIPAILPAIENLQAWMRQEACTETSFTVRSYQTIERIGWGYTNWFNHASRT